MKLWQKFKRKPFGIGKTYYPVRIAGFGIAGVVQTVFLYLHPEYSSTTNIFFAIFAFAWAHIAYFAYYLTDFNKKTEIIVLLLDNFWVGCFINAIAFNYMPSLLCVAMTCSNNMSVRGIKQFAWGVLLIALGALLTGLWNGFAFFYEKTLFLDLLSGFFMIIYFTYFGFLVFKRTIFVKKVSKAIEEQKEKIEIQQTVLEQKNQQILSSITYAQRIQQAVLPLENRIKQHLDHFILFKPRDIVSGDFYWFAEKQNAIFLAVADCTGHGVPGAFMSMVSISILDHLVLERNQENVNDILVEMHQKIRQALKQNESDNRDSLEIGLCMINSAQKTLAFAGAKLSLVYANDGLISQIKGDKYPIGGQHYGVERSFTQHGLDLVEMSKVVFYLYSDGYQDQFGGKWQRKFMSRNLRNMLLHISTKELAEQKEILENELSIWQGDERQIDDILVMGFRIGSV